LDGGPDVGVHEHCEVGCIYEEGHTVYSPGYCEYFRPIMLLANLKEGRRQYLMKFQRRFLHWGWRTYTYEERVKKGSIPKYHIRFGPYFKQQMDEMFGEGAGDKMESHVNAVVIDASRLKKA
jgi:hypothetical protein